MKLIPDDTYKAIMSNLGMLDSVSLLSALKQIENTSLQLNGLVWPDNSRKFACTHPRANLERDQMGVERCNACGTYWD